MKTLDQLALEYGTDKSSAGHSYTKYYEMFFEPLRDRYLNLLEIGIWSGASLKMWEQYFSHAKIVGMDIDEKRQYETDRITTIVGDQTNASTLKLIGEVHPSFQIIIDDATHNGIDQWNTFQTLFPYLAEDGLYIIEDILCAWDKSRWGEPMNILDRIREMTDQVQMSGAVPVNELCSDKHKAITKYQSDYLSVNIEWTFQAMGIIFIKKIKR